MNLMLNSNPLYTDKVTRKHFNERTGMKKKKLTDAQLKKVGRKAVKLLDDYSEYAYDHIWYILGDMVKKMRGESSG